MLLGAQAPQQAPTPAQPATADHPTRPPMPVRDPHTAGYVAAKELSDGTVPPANADGDFILTVGNDGQFRKFAEVAGQPQWAEDPRFVTNKLRVANRAVLIPLIRQATVFKTTAEWVLQLEQAGVPCGPINDLAQMFEDPQVKARGLAIELPHALAGMVPQVASPIRLSETPVEYRNAPPLLGEHTLQVLQRVLGLDAGAVAAFKEAGVL